MTAVDPDPTSSEDVDRALAEADALAAAGDHLAAIERLSALSRVSPDGRLLHRLLDLRHAATADLSVTPRDPWPPQYDDPFPDVVGRPPEIDAADLTGSVLGAAVQHHGSLIVRGLFDRRQVGACKRAIDEVQRHRDADGTLPGARRWFRPWQSGEFLDAVLRNQVWQQGGTWLADSPGATELVLRSLGDSGALDAITEHFGERPLFSLQKSTLRRSKPELRLAAWHQDGSFLGDDARAMNVWVALTPCGGTRPTPGLEIVGSRIDEILPQDGGLVQSSISDATVLAAAGDHPPLCPEFEPGDALLFDERMAHRSHLSEGMTEFRYAIECWFFAPANFADDYQAFLS
ncbi:MAG: hypothetical protein KF906_11760 [Actinobacteria bacterium]|nr:hypothetical protein [Actinomycetota bacterium]